MKQWTKQGNLSVGTLVLALLISVAVLAGLLIFIMKNVPSKTVPAAAATEQAQPVAAQAQKPAWPLPNTTPLAESIAWKADTLKNCGDWCKQLSSEDGQYTLTVSYSPENYTWYQQVTDAQGIRELITFTADRHGRKMEHYQNATLTQSLSNLNDGMVAFYDIHLAGHPAFAENDIPNSRVQLLIHQDGSFIPMRTTAATEQAPSESIMYPKEKLAEGWSGFVPSARLIDYLFPRP